jgi:hypothetical protein
MKAAKLFGLSLMAGVLVLSGPALAQKPKDDAKKVTKSDEAKKAADAKVIEAGKKKVDEAGKYFDDNARKPILEPINPLCNGQCRKLANDIAKKQIEEVEKLLKGIVCNLDDKEKILPNYIDSTFKGKRDAIVKQFIDAAKDKEKNAGRVLPFPASFVMTISAPCEKGVLDVKLKPVF